MAIATLSIDIVAKLASIERDMGRAAHIAESNAKRMAEAFSGVGDTIKTAFAGIAAGASIQWLAGFVTDALDAQDALVDLNKSTGISLDLLAGLKGAASSAGTDLEGVASAVNKLSINVAKAPEKFAEIGISAKEPLETLKQLADVFAAIEDPQQRAAVAAEAVGKSWASLAPLLSDGGEALGEAIGKFQEASGVTEESARAAADLNDKLDLLKASITAIGTAAATSLIPILDAIAPALTDSAKAATKASAEFSPLAETMRALIVVGGNVAFVLRGVGTEIGGMAAQIAALGRLDFQAFSNIGAAMREDADKSRKAFDAWERSIMTAGQTFNDYSNEGRGRGVAPDKTAGPTAAAIKKFIGPDGGGKGGGKTAKAIDEGARLIAHLQDQARAVQELTAVERLESEIADGKYKKVSAANLDQARGLAATIDAMKKSREEAKSAQDAFMAMSSEAAALFVAVRTPAEELEARIARLNELLESGAISMETFGRAAQEAGKSFQLIKPVLSEIDQFAVEAARNIQDAFAEFLFDPFKNGTEGMLKSFGDMIRRMIANAVAADLAKRLFGDFGKGDGVGGLLGDGLKWAAGFLKSANGNVFASPGLSAYSGSVVSRPTVFPFASGIGLMGEAGPEAILPLARGPNGKLGVQGGGHSITIHQTFNGATNPADVRRAGGAAAREVLGALQSARRYA